MVNEVSSTARKDLNTFSKKIRRLIKKRASGNGNTAKQQRKNFLKMLEKSGRKDHFFPFFILRFIPRVPEPELAAGLPEQELRHLPAEECSVLLGLQPQKQRQRHESDSQQQRSSHALPASC